MEVCRFCRFGGYKIQFGWLLQLAVRAMKAMKATKAMKPMKVINVKKAMKANASPSQLDRLTPPRDFFWHV